MVVAQREDLLADGERPPADDGDRGVELTGPVQQGAGATVQVVDVASTGAQATILYADDVAPERARFTILHELGHHLLASSATHLLDDIDLLAGDRSEPSAVEEAVCHRFAGLVLVPDDVLDDIVGAERLAPSHVMDLRAQTTASWEAIAVRASGRCEYKTAVVIVRDSTTVSFSAASSRLGSAWWPRGSAVSADGPLSKALSADQRARPEVYRHGLAYPEAMYFDSLRANEGLAIAVLLDKPSDGRFEIPDESEPSWKVREDFCERCNEVRDQGWCDACAGRFCPSCERCRCSVPPVNPVCTGCGLRSPRRPGARYCLNCEADGIE